MPFEMTMTVIAKNGSASTNVEDCQNLNWFADFGFIFIYLNWQYTTKIWQGDILVKIRIKSDDGDDNEISNDVDDDDDVDDDVDDDDDVDADV